MYTIAGKTAGVGSTTLPCLSIYSPSTNGFVIREFAVWNMTNTSCVYRIARLTSAGTPGTGLTEIEYAEDLRAPTATAFEPHTGTAPSVATASIRFMPIGAAIGAGYYWTWGGKGLVVPSGTANGVGLILAEGTGQILGYHIDWEEE